MAVVGSGSRGVPVPSYAAAGAAFAEAVAYLSSRDAQQMSESDLERELHRLGQELMDKLLQGHREQRDSLAEARRSGSREPTKSMSSSSRNGACLKVPRRRRPLRQCRLRARRTRQCRRDAARPRDRRRVRRRPHGVVLHIIVQLADAGTGDACVRPPPVASA